MAIRASYGVFFSICFQFDNELVLLLVRRFLIFFGLLLSFGLLFFSPCWYIDPSMGGLSTKDMSRLSLAMVDFCNSSPETSSFKRSSMILWELRVELENLLTWSWTTGSSEFFEFFLELVSDGTRYTGGSAYKGSTRSSRWFDDLGIDLAVT